MIGFAAGFLPWIVMGVLARTGLAIATGSALVVSVLLSARRLASGRAKMLEKAGLLYLLAVFLLSFASFAPRDPAIIAAMGNAGLGSIALISLLLGRPFITDYAREMEPPHLWDHPLLVNGTKNLTLAWSIVLLAMATSQAASPYAGSAGWVLRWVVPTVLLVGAVKGSHAYRGWLRRWQHAQDALAAGTDAGTTARP